MKRFYWWLPAWALLLCYCDMAAQTPDSLSTTSKTNLQELSERVDSALAARYYKSPFDSAYVTRPEGRLTLKLRLNQSGNDFHAKGTVNGFKSKADLSTRHNTTIAVAGIYRGLGLGFAINPAKQRGAYKDYELNFNYYSARLSLDASYQRSESLAGDIRSGDNIQKMEEGNIKMKVVNIAGYYIFNHRKFSYSAAFTQSFIQRQSAGSWLAGISFQGGSLSTTDKMKENNPDAPSADIKIGNVGIGGGYGYNWVLGRKWLVHISMLPTFVIYNFNNFTVNGEKKRAKRLRFNMIFNERAAIVHNFSSRYFAGITLAMNNSILDDNVVVVNQNKWRVRASVGMRF